MPVSALQHRFSSGLYQNKRYDNIRENYSQTQDISQNSSVTPYEMRRFGSAINRVVNSQIKLEKTSYQNTVPLRGMVAPLLIMLSQVRLSHNPASAISDIPAFVSVRDLSPSVDGKTVYPDNNNTGLSSLMIPIVNAMYETGKFISRHDPLKFPVADAAPMRGGQDRKYTGVGRFPRHPVFQKQKETTTLPPVRDDVKIEKMDFSCIEERSNLSITDIFRQIGKTFKNPISELAKESQVIHYVNNYNRCPTPEEVNKLVSLTSFVDKTISEISGLLPGSQPLIILQGLSGPLLIMIADSIDKKQINMGELSEVNEQILALGRMIVKTSPRDKKGKFITEQLKIPEGVSFKNKKLSVIINGINREVTYKNDKIMANYNGRHREVSYSPTDNKWFRVRGISTLAILSGNKGLCPVTLTHKKNGWDIYKRVEPDSGRVFGKSYILSKNKNRLIPYKLVKKEINRYKKTYSYENSVCEINLHRIKRSPCIISDSVNSLGLLGQKGFPGKLYRADRTSPNELNDNGGFRSSEDFGAINKMRDDGHALIVSESLEGALRYISRQGELYHIYEITSDDIRGVSINENIKINKEGVKRFLEVSSKKGDDIDWGYETNGAVFLDEAHIYHEDVTLEKVKYLGSNHDEEFRNKIKNLEKGIWMYYI
ncbi:hypothetical protein [Mixta mediterraneensis]|uniref:hypothetical protein n=1 Tax=Mixta mediterraneensis TaxID=2758443 RepID=UPI001873E974|nr:hypothetical protein [Mixta mediterraneensis]MBE5254406.1 hypothetical protein [Mixta mediterraneensis]